MNFIVKWTKLTVIALLTVSGSLLLILSVSAESAGDNAGGPPTGRTGALGMTPVPTLMFEPTVTPPPGVPFAPSKDNTLYEDPTGQLSNGQGSYLYAGRTDDVGLRRGLIAFNLAAIPTNATITSATLSMYLSRTGPVNPDNISLSRVLRDWGEGASNAGNPGGQGTQAQTGDATWLHTFYNTSFWTNPGGDFSPTLSATTTVQNGDTTYLWNSAGLLADVQSWVSDPANNFGWVILGNEIDLGSSARFGSSQNATHPPVLYVVFQATTPTPTPHVTPTPNATGTPHATPTPHATGTPHATPTPHATGTPCPSATPHPTGTPHATPTPHATGTPCPSATPHPTGTPHATPTPHATGTPCPSVTPHPTGTPHPSCTPHPTGTPHATPTPHATGTPHATPTPHATGTPHATPTPHATGTPHATPTPHATGTPHATPTPEPTPTASPTPMVAVQPLNISTRLHVETGQNVAIGGFMITGNSPRNVAIRGMGPSLQLDSTLSDPTLQLRGPDNSFIASNDNWRDNPTWAAELEAAGLAPGFDFESAIVATLPPGAYTAIVSGQNGSTGMGLVEVYDLDRVGDGRLANISTRGLVRTGEGVVIGGFILGGNTGQATVLLRAIGPSLTAAGIENALANPTLELRDSNGLLLQDNDNWKDSQQAAIEATGILPENDLEAAILVTLQPGSYTAIIAGKDGSMGVGLIEVYNLPPQ